MSLKLKVAANPPLQNVGSGEAFPLNTPDPADTPYADHEQEAAMAAESLAPAPRSRERIYEGLSWLNGNSALMGSTLIGGESGFWQSILVTIVLALPGTLFFAWLALRERKSRLTGDLERGLIECAIRRPTRFSGHCRAGGSRDTRRYKTVRSDSRP